MRTGSSSFAGRLATLAMLGGADRIVRTHLDQVMSGLNPEDREIAAQAFNFLVTPNGTKIACRGGFAGRGMWSATSHGASARRSSITPDRPSSSAALPSTSSSSASW